MKNHIDELAAIMSEFGLKSARLSGADWSIELAKDAPSNGGFVMGSLAPPVSQDSSDTGPGQAAKLAKLPAAKPELKGTPISSPMMGVFYSSPSPGSPNFCKEGDPVNAGDVVGLIEAMKVFNDIVSPISGKVIKIVAGNGALVQPGEPLVIVG